jgi:hypothetical protein
VLSAQAGGLGRGAVSASVSPEDDGVRIRARLLGTGLESFDPELVEAVPSEAVAYLGLGSLAPLTALLPEAAKPLRDALAPVAEQDEVALSVAPASPEPIVTLVARAPSAEAAREALGGLQERIATLLAGTEDATGQVPTFEERDLGDGVEAFALSLAGGGELISAVKGSRVFISNAEDGIKRAAGDEESIEDAERFDATVSEVPERAEAVGFFDFSQLLALAEQAGLSGSRAFETARSDLRRIRTLGAVVRRQGTDTTAELVLQIP